MKYRRTFVIFLLLILSLSFLSQNENITLYNQSSRSIINITPVSSAGYLPIFKENLTWGGGNSDSGSEVAMDSLGNIYIVGSTNSFGSGNDDLCLIKFSKSGNLLWNRTWGKINEDRGNGIAIDSSDNIYIVGTTWNVGYSDLCLIKYNTHGVLQWNRTWHRSGGLGVAVDSTDNIYVGGASNNDLCLIKYSNSGVMQWNRTWHGKGDESGGHVAVDLFDNIYLAGRTHGIGEDHDICLIKFNKSGVLQWNRTWGDAKGEYSYNIAVDSLGNIYIGGRIHGTSPMEDLLLIKYDQSGVLQWARIWGWNNSRNDRALGLTVDLSNNIYVVGVTRTWESGSDDICLIKYNQSGVLQWDLIWGGKDYDAGSGIVVDPSGKIYISGATKSNSGVDSDIFLVKFAQIPHLSINNPSQYKTFGNVPPHYDISIETPNLTSIWYTVDGGINNYTITQLTGKINQTAWDSVQPDYITIRFYARDLAGNVGYDEVLVKKIPAIPIEFYFMIFLISGSIVIDIAIIWIVKKRKKRAN